MVFPRNQDDERIKAISEILSLPMVTATFSEAKNLSDNDAYEHAIIQLRRAFAHANSAEEAINANLAAHHFPFLVSQRFVELVIESRPPALVIMAHYCVLLSRIRSYWYIKDTGAKLLGDIQDRLGPEWQRLIEWPKQQVREQYGEIAPQMDAKPPQVTT